MTGQARVASDPECLEVSVVIPCLNEANSIGICVSKAMNAFQAAKLRGEVVVADNGSTDGSIEIAEKLGARVVRVAARGYGSAHNMKEIEQSSYAPEGWHTVTPRIVAHQAVEPLQRTEKAEAGGPGEFNPH